MKNKNPLPVCNYSTQVSHKSILPLNKSYLEVNYKVDLQIQMLFSAFIIWIIIIYNIY